MVPMRDSCGLSHGDVKLMPRGTSAAMHDWHPRNITLSEMDRHSQYGHPIQDEFHYHFVDFQAIQHGSNSNKRLCTLLLDIYHNNEDERDEIAGCLQETRVNVIEECHRLLPCDYECKGDSLAKYEQRSRSDVLASLVKDVTQVHISKNPWPFGRTGERHKGTLHGK